MEATRPIDIPATPAWFRIARERALLSRKDAARLTGVSGTIIREWEMGQGFAEDLRFVPAFERLCEAADKEQARWAPYGAVVGLESPSWRTADPAVSEQRWEAARVSRSRPRTLDDVRNGHGTSAIYQAVMCLTCGAPTGERCISSKTGRPTAWHTERRQSAATAAQVLHEIAAWSATEPETKTTRPDDPAEWWDQWVHGAAS